MRIGIDAHFTSYELRGIGKFLIELVSGLAGTDKSNEYVVYGDSRAFPQQNGRGNVRFRHPSRVPYPIWEQFVLPRWARQDGIQLLHCPANTAPVALPKKVKLVMTIHDVMYLLPESVLAGSKVPRQRFGRLYRRAVVPRVARRAERVITHSEFSKQDVARYLKIVPGRIRAIYPGVDPNFASSADALGSAPQEIGGERLDSPFILAPGAGDPRKNTLRLIRAYGLRWRELANQEKLVIVGLRDYESSAASLLVRELGLGKQVLFAGYVSEELLAWLYKSSRCFLHPTLYEGFAHPVLEAMASGTPVITSNCTAVPEVAGDAAILVDPNSEKEIGDALVWVLGNEALRNELIQRGKARVRQFSWQNTVRKTLEVYTELGGHASARALAAMN